jgi:rhodanese-related sulfurtransferase
MKGMRKFLLGDPSEDLGRLVREGATIVDVRPDEEYQEGHIQGALHVPVGELLQRLHQIPKDRPVVTCNAADANSAVAMEILQPHGYRAYDAGAWTTLRKMLEEGEKRA